MDLILNIGSGVAFFSILFLIQKNKRQNFAAIFLIFLWLFRFILWYLKIKFEFPNFPWIYFLDQNLFFLDGVFFYWYIKTVNGAKVSSWKKILQITPFLVSVFLTINLFRFLNKQELYNVFIESKLKIKENTNSLAPEELIYIGIILFLNLIFLVLSYFEIKKYNNDILNKFSNIHKINLKWTERFLVVWILLLIIPLFLFFINYNLNFINFCFSQNFYITCHIIITFFFCYNVINQSYAPVNYKYNKKKIKNNNSINDDEERKMFSTLIEFIEKEKPFLEENLTIKELAKMVNLKTSILSQLIKNQANCNFYEFINSFRIKGVKKELIESNEQIIIIAYKNGFNSKSTFNKVFKDNTGVSPSLYRKKHTS